MRLMLANASTAKPPASALKRRDQGAGNAKIALANKILTSIASQLRTICSENLPSMRSPVTTTPLSSSCSAPPARRAYIRK